MIALQLFPNMKVAVCTARVTLICRHCWLLISSIIILAGAGIMEQPRTLFPLHSYGQPHFYWEIAFQCHCHGHWAPGSRGRNTIIRTKLWLRVESCVVRGCTKKVLTMWGHSSLSTLLLLSIAIHQYKIKLFNWKRTRSEIYIDTVKTENIDIFTWSSCFAKSININNSFERTNVLHHLSPLGAIIIIDPMPLLGVSHC